MRSVFLVAACAACTHSGPIDRVYKVSVESLATGTTCSDPGMPTSYPWPYRELATSSDRPDEQGWVACYSATQCDPLEADSEWFQADGGQWSQAFGTLQPGERPGVQICDLQLNRLEVHVNGNAVHVDVLYRDTIDYDVYDCTAEHARAVLASTECTGVDRYDLVP